jgi:hypothetical protein
MILNDFMVGHYIMACFVLRMTNHLSICFSSGSQLCVSRLCYNVRYA